jgi:hypothetical protein
MTKPHIGFGWSVPRHARGRRHGILGRILLAAVLVVVTAALLAGLGCSASGLRKIENSDETHQGPVLEEMAARIYKSDALESIVRAEHAVFDLNTSEANLRSVRVSFYDKGQWTGDVMSDHGVMFLKDHPEKSADKNDVLLRGHVRYNGKNNMTLAAPELRYHSKAGTLVSSGGPFEQKIPLKSGFLVCTGKYFETDKNLERFTDHEARLKAIQNPPNQK